MVRVVRLARVVDGHGCELCKSANEEMVYWSCGLVWCSVVWCGLVLIDEWMTIVHGQHRSSSQSTFDASKSGLCIMS